MRRPLLLPVVVAALSLGACGASGSAKPGGGTAATSAAKDCDRPPRDVAQGVFAIKPPAGVTLIALPEQQRQALLKRFPAQAQAGLGGLEARIVNRNGRPVVIALALVTNKPQNFDDIKRGFLTTTKGASHEVRIGAATAVEATAGGLITLLAKRSGCTSIALFGQDDKTVRSLAEPLLQGAVQ